MAKTDKPAKAAKNSDRVRWLHDEKIVNIEHIADEKDTRKALKKAYAEHFPDMPNLQNSNVNTVLKEHGWKLIEGKGTGKSTGGKRVGRELTMAEMVAKINEAKSKFDSFKSGKTSGLDVVAAKIVDINNVISELGVSSLDELNEWVTSLGGKTDVE